LLSFGAESYVFQFAIQTCKDQDIQNYNLAVVLYGCKTWSLKLRGESRLRVLESRVVRRIFGPRWYEAIKEWGNYTIRRLMT
jgi:hypothetical protein